jgi:Domain of unknown function (DUF6379)
MSTSDTVLTEESLVRREDGLGIALTLPWYRSLWLSSVTSIDVAINGKPVPAADLTAELGERTFQLAELPDQWDVLWFMQDRLVVVVPAEHADADGTPLDVEVTVELRLPYMRIAPMKYVTNHVTNHRTLTAR